MRKNSKNAKVAAIMVVAAISMMGCSGKSSETSKGAGAVPTATATVLPTAQPDKTEVKETYLTKLKQIDTDLEALDYGQTTLEMKKAAQEVYDTWDAALNEIYGVLQTQLSSDEMESLREKQRQWIADRDSTAEKAASEFKGGTMEGLEYTATAGSYTRERCYELVEQYMK